MKTFAEKQAELLQECREYIEHACRKYGERFENIDTAAFDAWKYIGWYIWLNGLYLNDERVATITYCEYLNGERELVVQVGNGLHNLECLPDDVALKIADQITNKFDL